MPGMGKGYKSMHGATDARTANPAKSGGSLKPVDNKSSLGMGSKPQGNAAPKDSSKGHESRESALSQGKK